MVTKAEVKRFLPGAKDALVNAIVDNWSVADAAGIAGPKRIPQFFANISVETMGLTKIVESLTYTSAQRIYDIFKGPAKNRRFKSVAECKPYVKNAKALGIKVYGGRMGNKPAPSTDGYDMRGGGMLQTTGRDGYEAVGYADNPAILQTNPVVAFKVAVQEWVKRGCNKLADADKTTELRAAINGGSNGLAEVKTALVKAKKVWGSAPAPTAKQTASQAPAKVTAPLVIEEGPTTVNPVTLSRIQVEAIQGRLFELGYTEVGSYDPKTKRFDGKPGIMTQTAILAFRSENGLPLSKEIDQQLLNALDVAKPRKIAPARLMASTAEVAAVSPEVKTAGQSKIIALVTSAGTAVAAAGQGILGNIQAAKDYVAPVQEFLGDIPGWAWLLAVAGIAGGIWWLNRKGEKAGVDAYQSGERR